MRQGQSLKVKLRLSLWLRRSLTLRRLGGAKFWRQNQVKQRQIGGLIVLQFAFASLGPAAGRAWLPLYLGEINFTQVKGEPAGPF